jgi:hypothetical protein
MSGWMITGWVFVGLLTAVNIFVFLKLKGASEQMLKMAFPQAKSMGEALEQMQKMMGSFGGKGFPNMGAGGGNRDAQLKAAMDMLRNSKR